MVPLRNNCIDSSDNAAAYKKIDDVQHGRMILEILRVFAAKWGKNSHRGIVVQGI